MPIPAPEKRKVLPVEVPAPAEQAELPVEQPETSVEQPAEASPEVPSGAEAPAEVPSHAPAPQAPVQAPLPPVKEKLLANIEAVMEEDLTNAFLGMSPSAQKTFKQKGEETARKIRVLLTKTHVNIRKIFSLIRDWLKLIPGVNRFFLEQEAKIKTDKIVLAAEEEKKHGDHSLS